MRKSHWEAAQRGGNQDRQTGGLLVAPLLVLLVLLGMKGMLPADFEGEMQPLCLRLPPFGVECDVCCCVLL